MISAGGGDRFHAETRAQWRAWLTEHAAEGRGVWLVTWKAASGRPVLPYEDAVREALAFGWIDGTARRVDDDRTSIWFTARKRRSGWARTNKRRVEELEPAVRAAVDDELEAAATNDETAYKVAMVRNTTAMTLLRLAEEAAR